MRLPEKFTGKIFVVQADLFGLLNRGFLTTRISCKTDHNSCWYSIWQSIGVYVWQWLC